MQGFARGFIQFDWRYLLAFQNLAKVVQGRNKITHRLYDVGLQIASPGDAFFGVQIDQDHRPVGYCRDARRHRPLQLQHNGPRPNAFKGQTLDLHTARIHVNFKLQLCMGNGTPCNRLSFPRVPWPHQHRYNSLNYLTQAQALYLDAKQKSRLRAKTNALLPGAVIR